MHMRVSKHEGLFWEPPPIIRILIFGAFLTGGLHHDQVEERNLLNLELEVSRFVHFKGL